MLIEKRSNKPTATIPAINPFDCIDERFSPIFIYTPINTIRSVRYISVIVSGCFGLSGFLIIASPELVELVKELVELFRVDPISELVELVKELVTPEEPLSELVELFRLDPIVEPVELVTLFEPVELVTLPELKLV